jgi:hypothetical protein
MKAHQPTGRAARTHVPQATFLLETAGVPSITAVQPLHVASWIELRTQTPSAPTVKSEGEST